MKEPLKCPYGSTYDVSVDPVCPCSYCAAERAAVELATVAANQVGAKNEQKSPNRGTVNFVLVPPERDDLKNEQKSPNKATVDFVLVPPERRDLKAPAPSRRAIGWDLAKNICILSVGAYVAVFLAGFIFEFIPGINLVAATLISFGSFLLVWWVTARKYSKATGVRLSRVQKALVVVAGLSLFIAFRTVLFQPFHVQFNSMNPTLRDGDFMIVNKFAYGFGQASLPFSFADSSQRWFFSPPSRGDILVFKQQSNEDRYGIDRVIGLPGETIQIKNSRLYINGVQVSRYPITPVTMQNLVGEIREIPTYLEVLPNAPTYVIVQIAGDDGFYSNTPEITVPPDSYFVLGDNRDNSNDSRNPTFGFVIVGNLVGRVDFILSRHEKISQQPLDSPGERPVTTTQPQKQDDAPQATESKASWYAFSVSPEGTYGWSKEYATQDTAEEEAFRNCASVSKVAQKCNTVDVPSGSCVAVVQCTVATEATVWTAVDRHLRTALNRAFLEATTSGITESNCKSLSNWCPQ